MIMSFAAMVLMGIGYIILAGIMGIKWGLLYRITGNIWAGLGDHLFNISSQIKSGCRIIMIYFKFSLISSVPSVFQNIQNHCQRFGIL